MNEELQNKLQESIDIRTKWLEEAIKIKHLAEYLSPKIQELPIKELDLSYDGKELLVTIRGGQESLRVLQEAGAEGFNPHYSSFGKFWYLTDGVLDLTKGYEVIFAVHNTDKPPKCHTEKRQKVVIEEVAICEETKKEL